MAFSRQGRIDEAREHLIQSGRMEKCNISIMNNWAWNKATHPDPKARDAKTAVLFAEVAAELTDYQNIGVLDTLAAAYATASQFDRAVSVAEKAMALALVGNEDELEAIRARLELYKQSQPYYGDD